MHGFPGPIEERNGSRAVMLAREMGALSVLLVLLIFCNSGFVSVAGGFFNFTRYGSPRKNVSRNVKAELEEKRGVPSGANPLHNR
ncbi:hypothetical protein VNO80_09666 [Phaseolus coccineus]|uniref:Uncharacterized protein n=1 Tax=Phaseolus coccineus TaxID=3886 RepID=A0AAN9N783_PHACN